MFNIGNLLLIFLIIFLSNIVQTSTGFAGSMLSLPFLIYLISLSDSKILITIIGIIWSIWILLKDYKTINWRFVFKIGLIMIIGIIIGIVLLKWIPTNYVILLMSIVILGSAIKNLIGKNIKKNSKFLNFIFGLSSGIMQGMVLMGGPFLVLVANDDLTNRKTYRSTLAMLWLFVNLVLMIIYQMQHLINKNVMILSIIDVIPLILAIYVGELLNKKLNHKQFELLVNILLIFSAVSMLVKLI